MLGTVVVIMRRKSSLNMGQEALGSDKVSNSFQSMEQRRALACSKSARWYSQTFQGGEGEGLLKQNQWEGRRIEKWSEEGTGGRILQASMLGGRKIRSILEGVPVREK